MATTYHKRDRPPIALAWESVTTRKDDLVEVLHGVAVADPYRWLENGDSPEVRTWDEAQNAATRAWLSRIDGRDALRARVRELLSIGYVGAPVTRTTADGNRRYFHMRREGTQEQAVLYEERDWLRDPLQERQYTLIDDDPYVVADGITVIQTPGHSIGHQSVLVETAEGVVCIAGDAVSTIEGDGFTLGGLGVAVVTLP